MPPHYGFSVYALPPAVLALMCLLGGITVVIRGRASRASVAFLSIQLAMTLWFSGLAGMYCATNEAVAMWWARFHYLGVPFIPSTVYLCSVVVMGTYARRKVLIWAGLLLSAFFSAAALGSDVLVAGVHRYWWGYYPLYGWLGGPYLVFCFGLELLFLRDYWVEYHKAEPGRHKLRLRALFIAFGIACLAGLDYLPCYGVPLYPFGYVPILICTAVLTRALPRYRLVDIVPAFAANEIISTMADPLAVCDADGRIRVVNQALCATLGYTEQELLGQRIECLAGTDAVRVERFRQLLSPGTARDQEAVLRTQAGEPVAVSISLSPLQDRGGNRLGTVLIARDVREQQRAEAALRESEEKYRTILTNIEDGYYEVDLLGNFTFFNQSLCRALGYSAEELMGMNYRRYMEPEKVSTMYEVFNRVYRTGESQTLFDWGITCKDGTKRIDEGSVSLIRDDAGRPCGFRGMVHDITERKQAEQALRAAAQEWQTTFDSVNDAVWLLDKDQRVVRANEATKRILQRTPSEVIGRQCWEVVHGTSEPMSGCPFVRMRKSLCRETTELQRDGQWFEVAVDPIVDEAGQLTGAVHIVSDITERKRAEEEKDTLLAIAQDINGTFDVEVLLDRVQRRAAAALPCDRVVTYCWDAARKAYAPIAWYGVPADLVPDTSVLEFRPGEAIVEPQATGQTLLINDVSKQELIPVEVLTHFRLGAQIVVPFAVRGRQSGSPAAYYGSLAAYYNEEGGRRFDARQVKLFEGIAREVGIAIEAADLYRAQEEETAIAGALARVGQEIISSLSSPTLLNRLCQVTAEVLGCDRGSTWLWDARKEAFGPVASYGASPEHWEIARLAKFDRSAMVTQIEAMERDGILKVKIADLPDSEHKAVGCACGVTASIMVPLRRGSELVGFHTADYCGREEVLSQRHERIARGIGQLASLALENVRLIEQLERANRLKSDFVATMSHELRTPLNIIMGYNDLLLDGGFGPMSEDQVDTLQRIGKSAEGLLELITATLDLSRLESGQVQFDVQAIDLPGLVGELDAEISELRENPNVDFAWDVAPELPELRSDPVKLKLVLKNLIGNAMKFTDAGSVVARLRGRDGGVEMTVADTGAGIAREMLPVIFEPFRQGEGPMTRQHRGVGLGLYIVRRLLDILGGAIEVESTVGQGSTFRVWVPNLAHGNATLPP
jgi:PAS domain S-box-containing protein